MLESILWIHRLKGNPDGDKSPFTLHPYLGIARWLVATGKAGKLVGRVSFLFGDLKDYSLWEFSYDLTWETTAFSLFPSVCG